MGFRDVGGRLGGLPLVSSPWDPIHLQYVNGIVLFSSHSLAHLILISSVQCLPHLSCQHFLQSLPGELKWDGRLTGQIWCKFGHLLLEKIDQLSGKNCIILLVTLVLINRNSGRNIRHNQIWGNLNQTFYGFKIKIFFFKLNCPFVGAFVAPAFLW